MTESNVAKICFEWFRDHFLKVNSGKSHVMLTTDNKLKINVKGSLISKEKIVKLLGVTVDYKLLLSLILILVCEIVTKKLHDVARVSGSW